MKLRALIGSLVLVFVWISAVKMVSAAPSLLITKLPVTGLYMTGPSLAISPTNGQWFYRLPFGSGIEEHRTHEFYDNLKTGGGGDMDHQSINGYISSVTFDGSSNITAFSITATIFNDTAKENVGWMPGTNSHQETLSYSPEEKYVGRLVDTKLTAEFSISAQDWTPAGGTGPYIPSVGSDIYAENEDQLAWYCWSPEEQQKELLGGEGGYHVPTWDFGDIPVGRSSTRIMQFTIPLGIVTADPRYAVIIDSSDNGTDILLNRTTSLKISQWVDSLDSDTGFAYPLPPLLSSDVSVFHNEEDLDFGDAPDIAFSPIYDTLLINDGARHSIDTNVYMGLTIDAEIDGQPTVMSLGDDLAGAIPDDEDGVTLTGPLYVGLVAVADITVSVDGYINAWMDFGSDNSWNQPEDYIIQEHPVFAGLNKISFLVSTNAAATSNAYARFRFSTATGITNTTGYATDGEVEDYMWFYEGAEGVLDYGDAPDSYKTLLASGGASHSIGGPWLGDASNGPDPEADGQPDGSALGDDSDGFDDESGVSFATATELIRGDASTYNVEVNGGGGNFKLWIDWDGSGIFDDPGEKVTDTFLSDGVHMLSITAPTNAVLGSTFARCRISLINPSLSPIGPALDGEVEDYTLTVADGYVDFGDIQRPHSTTTYVGTVSVDIYGQCWHDGITPPSTTSSRRIYAEIGYGPDGIAPWGGAWQWSTAGFNSQITDPNNEEFIGTVTISTTGTYDYAFRYSLNNLDWTYGDIDGSSNGYTNTQAGSIVVTALSPFSITNVARVATSNTATVWWDSEDRVVYQLQYALDLTDSVISWSNVGGTVTGNVKVDSTASVTSRVYRVIAPNAVGP